MDHRCCAYTVEHVCQQSLHRLSVSGRNWEQWTAAVENMLGTGVRSCPSRVSKDCQRRWGKDHSEFTLWLQVSCFQLQSCLYVACSMWRPWLWCHPDGPGARNALPFAVLLASQHSSSYQGSQELRRQVTVFVGINLSRMLIINLAVTVFALLLPSHVYSRIRV